MTSYHKLWAIFWTVLFLSLAIIEVARYATNVCGGG